MRRVVIPLMTVLALLLVATGGAAAADDAGTNIGSETAVADDGDVGICLVGVDSPCNGASLEEKQPSKEESTDEQVWIPEDQDGDGEIDDRFRGDQTDETEAGICLVGVDSPCNDGPADDDRQTSDVSSDDGRMGIPEDQDGDGEIDDRFRGDETEDADAGICLVGADSPCNDPLVTDESADTDQRAGDERSDGDRTDTSSDQDDDSDIVDRLPILLKAIVGVSLPLVGLF